MYEEDNYVDEVVKNLSYIGKKYEVRFDWISITMPFKYDSSVGERQATINMVELFCDFLGLGKKDYIYLFNRHINSYTYCYQLGEYIALRFCGVSTKMKIDDDTMIDSFQFEMRGRGCREFENLGNNYYDLFYLLYKVYNGRARRIDIAIDDFCGEYATMERMLSCCFDERFNQIENRLKLKAFRKYPKHHGNAYDGHSIDFGGLSSTKQLVIYDKKAERRVKGERYDGDYYVRFEMRFKERAAESLMQYFFFEDDESLKNDSELTPERINNIGVLGFSLLSGLVDFLEENNYSKENRCKAGVCEWWTKFKDGVAIQLLKMSGETTSTIDSKVDWVDYSVVGALASIILADYNNKDDSDLFPGQSYFIHLIKQIIKKCNDLDFQKRALIIINKKLVMDKKEKMSQNEFDNKIVELNEFAKKLEEMRLPF